LIVLVIKFVENICNWLITKLHFSEEATDFFKTFFLLSFLFLMAFAIWFISRKIIVKYIYKIIRKTEVTWDDAVYENKVFVRFSHILPWVFVYFISPLLLNENPDLLAFVKSLSKLFIVLVFMRSSFALLLAMKQIASEKPEYRDKPIASYVQLGKILTIIIGSIIILSVLLAKNPIFILGSLGAISAVLILIFKDTILGFIASIQLSVNNMVAIGDWVTVPNYGADGDVIEINLTTIKIRNFDMTISTVPTYSFISDSFKNWRGMLESDGRRIKRSVSIKPSSVRFCTPEMINRFKKIQLIKPYLENKQIELTQYNQENKIDPSSIVNGKNLTNIGVFRIYVENYIKTNPNINTEMVYMVRQLEPTERGLPIEVYAFVKEKELTAYEKIQSDIFDHILAVFPEFDLELLENPTGSDFKKLIKQ
jgi:miniconductance mechanosensitive channel